MATRRNLDDQEIKDAKRLKEVWLAFKAKTGWSQAQLAEACSWQNQSAVSQYVNGRIPLNLEALIKLSVVMKVPPSAISPRLAKLVRFAQDGSIEDVAYETAATERTIPHEDVEYGKGEMKTGTDTAANQNLKRLEVHGSLSDESKAEQHDYVFLPSLAFSRSAGADGKIWYIDSDGMKSAESLSWLINKGINPKLAVKMSAEDNSMDPTIHEGDSLLVDLGQKSIFDGKVYAIVLFGKVHVKRLFKEFDGSIRVVSDNPDKVRYLDRSIPEASLNSMEIIGRVVSVSSIL